MSNLLKFFDKKTIMGPIVYGPKCSGVCAETCEGRCSGSCVGHCSGCTGTCTSEAHGGPRPSF